MALRDRERVRSFLHFCEPPDVDSLWRGGCAHAGRVCFVVEPSRRVLGPRGTSQHRRGNPFRRPSCSRKLGRSSSAAKATKVEKHESRLAGRKRLEAASVRPLASRRSGRAQLLYWGLTDDGDSRLSFPITSPETTMSTRRLSLRPAAVLLSATGSAFPKPCATTLLIETPEVTR